MTWAMTLDRRGALTWCGSVVGMSDTEEELERLRAWKRDALTVLAEWELVWETAGCPGGLGESKAKAVRRVVRSARRRCLA